MKLCADILYWRLKEELTGVLFYGRKNSTLILNRPEFYLDRSQSFEENSVYVCSADHYHRHQSWEKMSVWYVWENTGILMPTMSGAALFLYMAARTFFKYSIWCRKCSINMIPGRKGSGSSCAMVQLCLKCWMPVEASLKIQCCL